MVDAAEVTDESSEKEQKSEMGEFFQSEERLKILFRRLESVIRKIQRSNLWIE